MNLFLNAVNTIISTSEIKDLVGDECFANSFESCLLSFIYSFVGIQTGIKKLNMNTFLSLYGASEILNVGCCNGFSFIFVKLLIVTKSIPLKKIEFINLLKPSENNW